MISRRKFLKGFGAAAALPLLPKLPEGAEPEIELPPVRQMGLVRVRCHVQDMKVNVTAMQLNYEGKFEHRLWGVLEGHGNDATPGGGSIVVPCTVGDIIHLQVGDTHEDRVVDSIFSDIWVGTAGPQPHPDDWIDKPYNEWPGRFW